MRYGMAVAFQFLADHWQRRVIISQDGNEVYLTFPEFDQFWIRYIQNGRLDRAGHMTMRKYGPWKIEKSHDIEHFAAIFLATCLRS